ncbi:MAG: acyl carrier protein [Verrucomicrobiales bacterium]|jgi:acyl carrier protein|nr:acyl carrier protein [Verrucomicrobiales bacterium]
MSTPGVLARCPLLRFSEGELEHSLRGFPEQATTAAKALRKKFSEENLEDCLYGIFLFYLPQGTRAPNEKPSGSVNLREDLGLDSLSLAEAMFKIEELFDVRIENSEIAEVTTLSDAGTLLFAKVTEEPPATTDE